MENEEKIMDTLTIRHAMPSDAAALEQLATLDSSRPLRSPVLVGEVGDELWAAVSTEDLAVISDPFRPSAEIARVLLERARQLRHSERRHRPRGRRFVRRPTYA
jgi:hypothetical protein